MLKKGSELPICFVSAMNLEIKQRESEGIVILDLRGKLILGPEDALARQEILGLLESGHKNLIVNLKNVADIDTLGVGTLAMFATKFKETGGRVVLVDLSEAHTKVWDTLKLNTVLDIYSDELSAVNSFFPERKVAHYDILEFVEEQEQKKALAERS